MRRAITYARLLSVAAIALGLQPAPTHSGGDERQLQDLFNDRDLVILGDVKHGVATRVEFFSSEFLFKRMAESGVTHVAVEMPRVLGHQAMGIETEADVEAFATDVVNSQSWHFTDPDHPDEENERTQRRVASALGRQVLLSKRFGIRPIFYDFNNPLGGFASFNDPVYRCLISLTPTTWARYGLDTRISKDDRDAAIMRERFSHDSDLADYILSAMAGTSHAKLIVMPGYAHAVLAHGLAEELERRLGMTATIVAVFTGPEEAAAFQPFLAEQSRLLRVDLSRPPHFTYQISADSLTAVTARQAFDALKAAPAVPSVCFQFANQE